MARPSRPRPTDAELEILHVLWARGPAALGEICAVLRETRDVATTTVATVLKVMEHKGLVRRKPGGRRSLWSARVSRSDAANRLLTGLLDRVFDGSAHRLVAHLVETGRLSRREIQELRQLLADEPPDS
ncbi:MAG TPA: BlaI/MecI/CopY family transcriptional regulator [Planctomycetaceae bacterium]|nr:BlaI/MecI/CopY family transcriptional regulator [Planctomycetaceae bacterium]